MPTDIGLHVAVLPDAARPIGCLLSRLSPAEQVQACKRTGAAHRHFVLGRLAAHAAMRCTLGAGRSGAVEVTTGSGGEPLAWVNGSSGAVSVSISHDSQMAAACAWRSAGGSAAGVDLERVRPTRIAESSYAFSRCERSLLSRLPEDPVLTGLAGWALKEAAWKALWPHQPPNPAAVEIRTLSLSAGRATLAIDRGYVACCGDAVICARLAMVVGPDGDYVLSVAALGAVPFTDEDFVMGSRTSWGRHDPLERCSSS